MNENRPDPIKARRASTRRVARVRTAIIGGAVVTSLAATGSIVALQTAGSATATSNSSSTSSTGSGQAASTQSALVTSGSGSTHATSKGS